MDKAKKVIVLVSLCCVAAIGALVGSHQLPANIEHWLALVGLALGGVAHALPSVMGNGQS